MLLCSAFYVVGSYAGVDYAAHSSDECTKAEVESSKLLQLLRGGEGGEEGGGAAAELYRAARPAFCQQGGGPPRPGPSHHPGANLVRL